MMHEEQPYLIGRCRWCQGPMWLMPDGTVTGPYPVEHCLCQVEGDDEDQEVIEMEIDLEEEAPDEPESCPIMSPVRGDTRD